MKDKILNKLEDLTGYVSKGTFMAWILGIVFNEIDLRSFPSIILLSIFVEMFLMSLLITLYRR